MKRILPFLLVIVTLILVPFPAYGFDLLKGVMPGEVSTLHQKVEGNCLECHTIGQKIFYDKCLVCHKEARRDVTEKRGYHGKIDASKCETCHDDHRGREFPLINFKKSEFEHQKTEFDLEGKHQKVECEKCHKKPKYRETPRECSPCHVKDDYHKEALGKNCRECHNAKSWRESKFDHNATQFPLLSGHITGPNGPVTCEKCHTAENFKRTPKDCFSCHEKDDKHKGSLGKSCENCHVAKVWKEIKFNHGKTDFPLEGKHQDAKCEKCHLPQKTFKETPKACIACHLKEDKHKGILGKNCEKCHSAESWKNKNFDHSKFEFSLIGVHKKVECLKCHKSPQLKDEPKLCYDCHKVDDYHKGKLGQKCDRCHLIVEKWKEIAFDHSTTKYPLVGKHIPVSCNKCHAKEQYKIPTDCNSCHQKDDKHTGKLGSSCNRCHTENSWKETDKFNHQKSSFPLEGKHIETQCALCHKTQLFKDTPKVCIDCHKKDDEHKGLFGKKCEVCHSAQTWKRDNFDHFKEAGYSLQGKHKTVKCPECHTKTLFVQKTSRMCVRCHRNDDIHEEELGLRCEICHTETDFKLIKKGAIN